ncbi:MAG: DUF2167 domain-containing protein [Opitutaceae bacterium]|nr:DUF2167 domain-containing protein [Opitutaceae bacterium]
MKTLRVLAVLALGLAGVVRAADAPAADRPKTREEALTRAGVKLTAGPATVPLGKVAELKVPAGAHFVGPDSIKLYYQLTQNQPGGKEVGVLLAKGYSLYFDYDDSGYVKDDDKKELDAAKLMKAMTANEDEANAERKRRGWDEMKITGWATQPHYDEKTNNLKWAINLTSSHDQFKEVFINESIRLLGRGGVMNVTLVSGGGAAFKAAETEAEKLLAANFAYIDGQKYSEFKSGDKVAAYGLAALVLGGGAVAAAKLGWLASLGVWFGKFWKMIVAGLVAVGLGIKKLFGKVTGAQPSQPPPPAA